MSRLLTTALGDRVAHDVHEPSDGAARGVVLFEAGAGPWREIDPDTTETARLLAEAGVRAVVHDRVGRGESAVDGGSGPIGLDRESAALEALVTEHSVAGTPVVLVGHSSGCSIALRSVADGLQVSGLVLWEAPLDPTTTGVDEWLDEVEDHLAAGRAEDAVATYMRDIPDEILDGVRSSPVWPAFVAQAEGLRPDCESLRWGYSAPLPQLLGGLDLPVVACHGEQTYAEMEASTAALVAALPRARAEVVAGAHHTWEPAAMADLLAAVVAEVGDEVGAG